MTVISIIGTSGVGKSFLIKQLSAITNRPALFEGEEGTIPQEILENVFSEEDSNKRYVWFLNHYKKILITAHKISEKGLDCYTDCSRILARATLNAENHKIKLDIPESDKTIVLTASKEKLQELMKLRNRVSENDGKAIKRSLRIQEELVKLAKENDLTIIDRTNLDFNKEEDLKKVLKKIK